MVGETAVIVIAARQRGPVAITIHVEDQQAIGARPPGPHERVRGPDVAIPHALLLPARRVRVNGLGVGVGVGVRLGLGLGLGSGSSCLRAVYSSRWPYASSTVQFLTRALKG